MAAATSLPLLNDDGASLSGGNRSSVAAVKAATFGASFSSDDKRRPTSPLTVTSSPPQRSMFSAFPRSWIEGGDRNRAERRERWSREEEADGKWSRDEEEDEAPPLLSMLLSFIVRATALMSRPVNEPSRALACSGSARHILNELEPSFEPGSSSYFCSSSARLEAHELLASPLVYFVHELAREQLVHFAPEQARFLGSFF